MAGVTVKAVVQKFSTEKTPMHDHDVLVMGKQQQQQPNKPSNDILYRRISLGTTTKRRLEDQRRRQRESSKFGFPKHEASRS